MARAQLWIADEDQQKLRAIAIRNATADLPGREMPPSVIGTLESREPLELSDDRDEIEPLELLDARDETTRALLERDSSEWSELLHEAFYQPRPPITPSSIATVARQQGLAPDVASMLEPLLEHELFLRLCVAHALARLTADSQAIAITFRAALALTQPPSEHFRFPPTDVARPIEALLASKPRAAIPQLVAFLPRVQDDTLRREVLSAIDRLILNRFAVPDGDPAEVRALTFALLGKLLKDDTVEKSLVEQVAEIVRRRTRAKILGEGFDAVIKELAVASGVGVEDIGWSIWREPLTSPNEAERGQVDLDAALWAIGNLSGEEGPPWTWRVYDHIARFLRHPEHLGCRIEAIRRLGKYGPTSNRDPLPDDVKDLRNTLELLKKDENPEVRSEAEAALARNRARGEGGGLTKRRRRRRIASVDAEMDATRAAGPVKDESIDLAANTFGPVRHPVLVDLERAKTSLDILQAPIVDELRETLRRLHYVGSLGSTAENAEAVAGVNGLAKRCGMDFTYQEEPVALVFSDDKRYRAGTFRLRTFGNQKFIYDRTSFPTLELTPADATGHNSDKPTLRT